MGVRILYDQDASRATLYCSTTEWSIGPVFLDNDELGLDGEEIAERFLKWLPADARGYEPQDLERKVSLFLGELPGLYAAENKEIKEEINS